MPIPPTPLHFHDLLPRRAEPNSRPFHLTRDRPLPMMICKRFIT